MSVREVFNPKFDDFHGRSMVTWKEAGCAARIDENLLYQYNRWKVTKDPKHEPSVVFWQSGGPAIVRALNFCGAEALVIEYASDRKVSYRWFARSPRTTSGTDWYVVCHVYAEDVHAGGAARVHVDLPSGEEVVFTFATSQMIDWLKPELVDQSAPEPEKG